MLTSLHMLFKWTVIIIGVDWKHSLSDMWKYDNWLKSWAGKYDPIVQYLVQYQESHPGIIMFKTGHCGCSKCIGYH